MNVAGALRERDREIKFLLRGLCSESLSDEEFEDFNLKLNEIFSQATTRWPDMIAPFIGKDRADAINQVLEQKLT